MQRAPLIGVSGSVDENAGKQYVVRAYFTSILQAGGVPLLMSLDMSDGQAADCLRRLDGLLLAGGVDLDPALYGELPQPKLGEVHPLRDRFEVMLVREAIERKLPTLGICRGIQSINVALGGTLYQDLPSQYHPDAGVMLHDQTAPTQYPSHRVSLLPDTPLRELLHADSIAVNSFHHQAVKQVAPELRACAEAPDGLVEGVYHPDQPFLLGVQWHPERMDDEPSRALFQALVDAARAYGQE